MLHFWPLLKPDCLTELGQETRQKFSRVFRETWRDWSLFVFEWKGAGGEGRSEASCEGSSGMSCRDIEKQLYSVIQAPPLRVDTGQLMRCKLRSSPHAHLMLK